MSLTVALERVEFLPLGRVTDDTSILTLRSLVFEPLCRWRDGRVGPGLKLGGVEIPPVVLVPHRERLQLTTPRGKIGVRHRRDQAGIQPAGQKRRHRHITDQLPLDGIHDQIPHVAGGGLEVVGVVVVEVIFVYPGMGQYMVDAVTVRDMPVVQACGLIFAAVYILLNMTADIIAIVSNPRLRHPR